MAARASAYRSHHRGGRGYDFSAHGDWPARTVRDLRTAFIDVAHLQPRITIKNRVYLEQTAQTAEFATVVRRSEVEHEFLHSWAGSTKRIRLHGTFLVKAGFDLHKNFSVDVRSDEIDVHLPAAQILGVEQHKIEVLPSKMDFGISSRPKTLKTNCTLYRSSLAKKRRRPVSLPKLNAP